MGAVALEAVAVNIADVSSETDFALRVKEAWPLAAVVLDASPTTSKAVPGETDMAIVPPDTAAPASLRVKVTVVVSFSATTVGLADPVRA